MRKHSHTHPTEWKTNCKMAIGCENLCLNSVEFTMNNTLGHQSFSWHWIHWDQRVRKIYRIARILNSWKGHGNGMKSKANTKCPNNIKNYLLLGNKFFRFFFVVVFVKNKKAFKVIRLIHEAVLAPVIIIAPWLNAKWAFEIRWFVCMCMANTHV